MIIAEQKRKENIIEYIIYIRQIQDIIRAVNFDIDQLDKIIISQFTVSEKIKVKIRQWYADIIISMKEEKIEIEGDLQFVNQLINDLDKIHNDLLNDSQEIKHAELYRWAKNYIAEFKLLSGKTNASEIRVCINALHSLFLLRIKKEIVSEETMQAMQTFSNLLAHIALKFRLQENPTLSNSN